MSGKSIMKYFGENAITSDENDTSVTTQNVGLLYDIIICSFIQLCTV